MRRVMCHVMHRVMCHVMRHVMCRVVGHLPPMSGVERVLLIQERLKGVQNRWSDLKAEVAYIERKRRRARRKEREGGYCSA